MCTAFFEFKWPHESYNISLGSYLKVPICDIFNCSDFHDYYTIQCLWGVTLWLKLKHFLKIFRVSLGPQSLFFKENFFQLGPKTIFWGNFWDHLLVSIAIKKIFLGTLKIIINIYFLTRMLRPLCMHWAYRSGTDACTEHTGQELMRELG